jgi:two-component system chemotaxis response regulator CheB
MPRMDGLTFLRILSKHHPMPVVIISSLTKSGSQAAMQALEAGAVDVLAKPETSYSLGEIADQLIHRIKGAAASTRVFQQPAATAPTTQQLPSVAARHYHPRQLLLFGASTGGTEALKFVLARLPGGMPGMLIVQHIPPYFSKVFADNLASICQFEVREAVDGDVVRPGLALVAPGDFHMGLQSGGSGYQVFLKKGPLVNHTRPAVDILFSTAADFAGKYSVATILTGMGKDGAIGMKKLKSFGARTIAQSEETCVVYGMPKAAVDIGAVDQVLPLNRIPQAIVQQASALCPAPQLQPS